MREASFYTRLRNGSVRCTLCPRSCLIRNGKSGFCGVRQNQAGVLFSLSYGRLCSMAVDPIEKKPLFHFAPGTSCLSVSAAGCNLGCSFCQNWHISQPRGEVAHSEATPESVVEAAISRGVQGIAYTYTEPTVFIEFAMDIMRLARRKGLYNVWVSNGFINPEPAMEASRLIDAINIDLKGSGEFYRKLCSAPGDAAVKKACLIFREQGVWIEITNLVVPGHNDSDKALKSLSSWVASNLGPETPLHFSRFFPDFRMHDASPTSVSTLERAAAIARKSGLNHVYVGNVPGHAGESTLCPKCGSVLIKRAGYRTGSVRQLCRCGYSLKLAGMKWARKV